jgi:hypothetical protein
VVPTLTELGYGNESDERERIRDLLPGVGSKQKQSTADPRRDRLVTHQSR